MADDTSGTLPLESEQHIVLCRQAVRTLCGRLRFSLVDQTKVITAASELSRNTLVHGGGGRMRWELLDQAGRSGLRMHFEDEGPGIADLQLALADGWTSGGGMGLGLPGSRRLVNDFDIRTAPGQGTCVTITKWK
ncbi:anti-sigma regulatory factor [Paracidovorax citrulli]|uniref:Anti-sigma regulatory factor, serine/threonine protein kinase n=2 Tax=Paracidovorax citrulli TaxID=80869 RepID=A1TRF1_PARC0|nr:anti-sigma regulatory factor [Paracidovorax citrulli]ABM33539.1 putative anti-sigma regulatory factor, serine/threonine protein kinase [Paracidovorax citrulli AAC00-1]ATG94153.1 anti-sigma regulatory factor [Paracidovorax citrulli]MVT28239.1 anti-sigma regulatory factor [Paracidovorax citrulli]PVY62965.1 serine/threonine-protein kinase RsbT [Paracidovorax citrulli]QCX12734.1 anti-sigma regulatory factor [Paracidovorax citrulli]